MYIYIGNTYKPHMDYIYICMYMYVWIYYFILSIAILPSLYRYDPNMLNIYNYTCII